MNMISLPRPTCPYYGEDMRRWPLGQHTLTCDTCRRPIVRYLSSPTRRIFRLRPLYAVIHIIGLAILVIGFATVWLAGFPPRAIIPVIAVPMVIFAASGIADGWLSWRTGIDRAGQKLRKGGGAKVIGLGRVAFGVAGIVVATIGLLAFDSMSGRDPTGTRPGSVGVHR